MVAETWFTTFSLKMYENGIDLPAKLITVFLSILIHFTCNLEEKKIIDIKTHLGLWLFLKTLSKPTEN